MRASYSRAALPSFGMFAVSSFANIVNLIEMSTHECIVVCIRLRNGDLEASSSD
jgi:hypothetical protein